MATLQAYRIICAI